tara:strand:+ start:1960 stop:2472 length:513 start_codon:yes stop_codon:yes gene_type:complete
METVLQKFNELSQTPSDINEHLVNLKKYAEECEHITEMGVRWCVSSYAFLASNPKKMISYDYKTHPNVKILIEDAKKSNIDFTYIEANTRKIEIEETDFLFLDTEHSYEQVKIELLLHANKVRKYIAFHDTVSFKNQIGPAIEEWVNSSNEWELEVHYPNNNGVTIYKRK